MKDLKFVFFSLIGLYLTISNTNAQDVTVTVNANQNQRAVSPYIYGANNWFDKPAQFYKDAGLRMARTNGGNNATKYNWRKKLSSHPDWYNNVYVNDWDKTSQDAEINLPNVQLMWAFQLLGRVASSKDYNFNDWAFNKSQYWNGVNQNLAGGGLPDTVKKDNQYPTKAKVEGNINLYTEEWPADSTVGILNHWFGAGGLGLNKKQFLYWNMDNEVDVWDGTHDDVMSKGLLPANEFMDKYIEVAKKARALFPEIKLCGPVATSEWQWFKWPGGGTTINGKYYCWLEYFIKRCADEEKASGIRVLDVLDIHNYARADNDKAALQLHRMYYDQTYNYPYTNGVYTINDGWDTSIKSEYIFKRINDWLTTYYGANHGITCGLSEWHSGTDQKNANSTAVVYASHLGTFANNGVELFTPWSWYPGMWETLHLFSRYGKEFSIQSTSTREDSVSAYSSVNTNVDSMTIFLVNRSITTQQNVSVKVSNMPIYGTYDKLSLYNLPKTETFVSHTTNALKAGTVSVLDSTFTVTLPPLSVTAVILKKNIQPVFIRPGKNPVCQGDNNITFSIPSKQGAHYKWTYSGTGATIANDTLNAINVNFSNTATSGVLTVNAKYPADSTWTLDVTVGAPVAQPSIITTGKDPICKGDNNIAYSVINDPAVSYNWTYSGTGASIFNENSNIASVNYSKTATSGTLKVTVANTSGCVDANTNNRTLDVTINSLPTPDAIVASKDPVVQGDNGITYSVTNDASATYNWVYSGTGASISNNTTNIATVDYSSSATSGNISVTVTNAGGCANSNDLSVTVNPKPTGIDNASTDDFYGIFNSGKEVQITYHLTTAALVKIELFNTQGRLIKRLEDSFKVPGNYDIRTSTNGLVKDVYIIRYSAGATHLQKKVLVID